MKESADPRETADRARLLGRLDSAAARFSHWLTRANHALLFLFGYLLLHFAIRALILPGGMNDDSEQLLHSQSLAWGYDVGNPPLLTWIEVGVQQLLGVSILTTVVVKYALLAAFFAFSYGLAAEMIGDLRYRAAATLAPLALYYVGWDGLRSYSHSILLIVACLAFLLALLRLERRGGLTDYLLLGLALGLGALSKYNFLLFAGALLLAGLTEARFRRAILDPRSLIALAIAAVIVLPNLVWMLEHRQAGLARLDYKLGLDSEQAWLAERARGLKAVATSLFDFTLPLSLLLLLCFPRALPGLWRAPEEGGEGSARALAQQRLVGRLLLILLAVFAALVLFGGLSRIKNHIFFVFIPFGHWFLARAALRPASGLAPLHRFLSVVLLLCAVATAVILVKIPADPLNEGRKIYLHYPYGAMAEKLRGIGFERGTLIARDDPYPVSGLLRPEFPDSRVHSLKYRIYEPPPAAGEAGPCLVVWPGDSARDPETPPDPDSLAPYGLAEAEPVAEGRLEAPFAFGQGRMAYLNYRLYGTDVPCR